MLTNCPNCGAPIKGYICEYCGTQLKEAPVEEPTLYADNIPFNPLDVSLVSLYDAMTTLYQSQISQMSHYNQVMSANCCVASNTYSQLQAANANTRESLSAQMQSNIYTYTATNLDDKDDIDLEDSLTLPSDRRLTAEETRTYVGPIIFVVLIILGLILRSYLIGV